MFKIAFLVAMCVAGFTEWLKKILPANSRIEDTDMAEKIVELSKNQILSQSSLAMMAQSNSKN